MGTRGFLAFVADGETKVGYNHNDSYPDHLGRVTLNWARSADLEAAAQAAAKLRVVGEGNFPSDEEVASLGRFANLGVGGASERVTWYQLLRETQGEAGLILEAGAIVDASDFPADSLFAEWGYVLDFDTQVFEVYEGFQKAPHNKGRFASAAPGEPAASGATYYPVALVASWPLKELPSDEDFMRAFETGDDE